jgi:hypothetical protein
MYKSWTHALLGRLDNAAAKLNDALLIVAICLAYADLTVYSVMHLAAFDPDGFIIQYIASIP